MKNLERIKRQIDAGTYDVSSKKLHRVAQRVVAVMELYGELIAHGYDHERALTVVHHSTGMTRKRIREIVDVQADFRPTEGLN